MLTESGPAIPLKVGAGEVVLAIDVGTSSTRVALLIGTDLAAVAERDQHTDRPRPGWAEQDPTSWWANVCAAAQQLANARPDLMRQVASVGIVGQTPTLVLVDRDLRPTGPAVIWQDQRASAQAAWLRGHLDADDVAGRLGMALPMDATYPAARLRWFAENRPDQLARTATILQPKDYIVALLTGIVGSDAWCSKGLVHVIDGSTDAEYLAMIGIDASQVPTCREPWEAPGRVSAAAAARTGIPAGVPVTVGWSDALAGMLATGVFAEPGQGFVLAGTSDIVGVTTPDPLPASHGLLVVPPRLAAGTGVVYGPTQSGGQSLTWLTSSVLGRPVDTVADTLPTSAARRLEAPIFLPYLQGERAPLWDATARGVLLGLTASHTDADLLYAVMEGVAFSNRHVLEVASDVAGVDALRCRLGGRPSRMNAWNRIRCDVLGMPIEIAAVDETSLVGAGMLARIHSGMDADLGDAGRRARTTDVARVEPDLAQHAGLDERYAAFRSTYLALVPVLTERAATSRNAAPDG